MTTQDSTRDRSHFVVERLTHTFGDWLKHRRELNEMRGRSTRQSLTALHAITGLYRRPE